MVAFAKIFLLSLLCTRNGAAFKRLNTKLPRGGSSQKRAAVIYTGLHAAVAVIGFPAPEVLADDLGITLREESLDYFWADHLFATMSGIALTSFLALFRNCSASPAILFGTLPFAFVRWKSFLRGSSARLGLNKGAALLMDSFVGVCIFSMASKQSGSVWFAKALSYVSILFGLTCSVFPSFTARQFYGTTFPPSGPFYYWHHVSIMAKGVMGALLSTEVFSANYAIGFAASVWALASIDCAMLRMHFSWTTSRYQSVAIAVFSTVLAGALLDCI